MLVGSCFSVDSFTCSIKQARAIYSTGVTSCRTDSSSESFIQQIDGGIHIPIKHQSARRTGVGTLTQGQFSLDVSASRACLA